MIAADSVRNSIAVLLRGVVSNKQIMAKGIFGHKTLVAATKHILEHGMTAVLSEVDRGRYGVPVAMRLKIRAHVMNPDNRFTKVLPFGNTKVHYYCCYYYCCSYYFYFYYFYYYYYY